MLQFGILVPVSFICIKLMGGRGAWIATPLAMVITSLLGFLIIYRYDKELEFKDRRLLVEKNFGKHEGREIEITASSMLEVVGMSRIAKLFCKENNVSEKQANILALCIEELGENIIEHGFDGKKPHSMYMRVVVKDDEIILRIRDDCKSFNPVERYNMVKEDKDDPVANIGLKIVMGLCTSVNYISMYELNLLILKMPVQ